MPADPNAQVLSVKAAAALIAKVNPDSLSADDRATLLAAMKRLLGAKNALCTCDCAQCLANDCANCSDLDCVDENCEAHQNNQAETLAALRSFTAELRA